MTSAGSDGGAEAQPQGACTVWLVDRAALAERLLALEQATPSLADDEIIRAAAIPDRAAATSWTAGRIALRLVLERLHGCDLRRRPFERATSGRPHLPPGQPSFSLSDSGTLLAIAIAADGPIGIDIERPRTIRLSAARAALILAAASALGHEDGRRGGPLTLLQAWVRIEAFAKAADATLAATLARMGVQGHGQGMLTVGEVGRRARDAAIGTGLIVADLALPDGLTGAIARSRNRELAPPCPSIRPLDDAMLDRLIASRMPLPDPALQRVRI